MKTKVKKSGSSKEESFIESIDFRTWWEEFSFSVRPNGTAKYNTIWTFITAKTKIKWQQEILWWMLGPTVTVEADQRPKFKYDQFDWEEKRERGFWFSKTNITEVKQSLAAKASAYEKVKKVGEVNIELIERLKALMREIDREFSGRLFLPELSMKENQIRTSMRIQLMGQIQAMLDQAQITYGRSQGLDIAKLDQFFAMFGQGMGQVAGQLGFGSTTQSSLQGNRASDTMTKMIEMVANKAYDMDMELPSEDMNTIVREAANPKKKTVQ